MTKMLRVMLIATLASQVLAQCTVTMGNNGNTAFNDFTLTVTGNSASTTITCTSSHIANTCCTNGSTWNEASGGSFVGSLNLIGTPADDLTLSCVANGGGCSGEASCLTATGGTGFPASGSSCPSPPSSPPANPDAWNRCDVATAAWQAACTEPAQGVGADNLTAYAAYCSNTVCKNALLNATFLCPDPCDSPGPGSNSRTSLLDTNATDRLAFCDTCTGARVRVSSVCGTATLPSVAVPADPVAAYCTNTECSRALQDMMGNCQEGVEDTQETLNSFGHSSNIPYFGRPADGAAYFDDAVAALSYCVLPEPPSAEMLEDQTALRRNWFRIFRRYAYGPTGTPAFPLTDAYPTDADYNGPLTSFVSLGTYGPVSPPFAQGTVYQDRSTCESACNALPSCWGNITAWPNCFDETLNGGQSCGDSCDNCPFSWCRTFVEQGVTCITDSDGAPSPPFELTGGCTGQTTPSWRTESESIACTWDDGTGGQVCPSRGAAFNSSLAFQVADWSAYGGRPADWERYAFAYEDAATRPWPTVGATAVDGVERYTNFKRTRISTSLLFSQANNSGVAIVGPGVCEAVIFRPQNLGLFILNGSATSNIAVIQFINRSPESLALIGGNVNLAGGFNYGPGPVAITTLGRVIVSNIDNYGTVSFENTQRGFLLLANNFAGGSVTFTNVAGRVYRCNNFGTLNVTSSNATIDSVVNNGTITANDVTGRLVNASNGANGVINVNAGSYTFVGNLLRNYGTITVSGDVTTSSGRRLQTSTTTLSIEGGENYGSVDVAEGVEVDIVLDVNNGPINLASGVTGNVRVVSGTVTAPTGAGAASVTVSLGAAAPSGGGDSGGMSTGGVIGIILGAASGPVFGVLGYLAWKRSKGGGGNAAKV